MVKKPNVRSTKAEQLATFLSMLQQLEALVVDIDLGWPGNIKADVIRRLNRVIRAIRMGPEGK
jgi:hypothetical protein